MAILTDPEEITAHRQPSRRRRAGRRGRGARRRGRDVVAAASARRRSPGAHGPRGPPGAPRPAPVPGAAHRNRRDRVAARRRERHCRRPVLGDTPQRIELRGGAHEIRVRQGRLRAVLARRARRSRATRCGSSPELASEAPRLSVDADVPGAAVFLDRKPFGKTPLAARAVTPGSHRLNVTAEGYEMYSETIEVATGTRRGDGALQGGAARRGDRRRRTSTGWARAAAGSLATVEGLRYETSDPEEASARRSRRSSRCAWTTSGRTCA